MSEDSTILPDAAPESGKSMLEHLIRRERAQRALSGKAEEGNTTAARRKWNNDVVHPALRGLKGQADALDRKIRATKDRHARRRMRAVLEGLRGLEVAKIALKLHRERCQIVKWFRDFRASEIEEFAAKRSHRPRRITFATFREFRSAVKNGEVSSPAEAQDWLDEQAGTPVHRATVFRYLQRARA